MRDEKHMKILITSVGTATSVNLLKKMKSMLDISVVGTDINDYGYTAGSLMCSKYYKVPYATSSDFVFVIKKIIEDECIDVYIPINDMEIVGSVHSDIGKNTSCGMLLPTARVIDIVHNKDICNKVAAESGLKVADYLPSDAHYKKIRRDKAGVGSKGIKIFDADTDVDEFDEKSQIIQKYVSGSEYTVECLSDREGTPLYIIPRKRLEVKNGVATKVIIENNNSLIKDCEKILANLKLPGFSNIQFIVDADKNNWFIEVNPRFSGCGSATMLACENYFPTFLKILNGQYINSRKVNAGSIRWGSVVTRYYEEMICDPMLM